ncbi:DHA2 family efflux MFS transporter permease subunit [Microlunatus speluncae]|uniref:DHA2 family efflux MFS transporter permease subunit n=1 Tax=Microlunatus speluncae TaxID=2594267 RepID=UPI0013755C57|nr:DHA2 family efflux MFS transporter permease subunit [Microlunatus speluncae]
MSSTTRRVRVMGAMVVLIVANFMDLMDTTVVNVALPSIQAELGAGPAAVEWLVAAYTLALAATLIIGGRLGDIVGLRRVFLIGIAGFTVTSVVAAAATDAGLLVAARALQGGFAGLMVPQVLAGVQALYPPERRAPVYGVVGFITGTASVVGPVLSGVIVSTGAFGFGWRAIFMINVPIGIALFLAAIRLVPATRPGPAVRLDLPGTALVTTGVLCLILPLIEGREHGWPWWSWVLLAVGPLLLIAFAVRQRRLERAGGTPLIPLRLFADRGYRTGCMINFCFQAGLVSFFLFLTLYLQQALRLGALQSGLVWLGLSLGALAGSSIAAPLLARIGHRVMAVGAALFALSMILVGTTAGTVSHWWALAGLLTIGGIGMGLIIVPVFDVGLATVPRTDAGSASGTLTTIQQLGGSFGVAVIGVIFYTAATAAPTPATITHGLHLAVAGSVIALLLAGLTALLHRARTPADAELVAA